MNTQLAGEPETDTRDATKSGQSNSSQLVSSIDPDNTHNTYQVYISYFSGELMTSQVTPTSSYLSCRISPTETAVLEEIDSFVETAQDTFMEPIESRLSGDGCEVIIESGYVDGGISYIPEQSTEDVRVIVTESSTPELYSTVDQFIETTEDVLMT